MLDSAWFSGKVGASNDYCVGKNYEGEPEVGCRGVQGDSMTSKQEHFPLLLVRRVKWCCLGATGLLYHVYITCCGQDQHLGLKRTGFIWKIETHF